MSEYQEKHEVRVQEVFYIKMRLINFQHRCIRFPSLLDQSKAKLV